MFCTKCGSQCSDSALFCSRCGNTLKANNSPSQQMPIQQKFTPQYPSPQAYIPQKPNTNVHMPSPPVIQNNYIQKPVSGFNEADKQNARADTVRIPKNTKSTYDPDNGILFYNDGFYSQSSKNPDAIKDKSSGKLKKIYIVGSVSLIAAAIVICGIIFLPGILNNNNNMVSDNALGTDGYHEHESFESTENLNEYESSEYMNASDENTYSENESSEYIFEAYESSEYYESSEISGQVSTDENEGSIIDPPDGILTYSDLMISVFHMGVYDDPDKYDFYEVTTANINRANTAHYYLTNYEFSDSLVSRLESYQVDYLLNILAASNGRKFSDDNMSEFFNSLEWYNSFPDSYLLGKDEVSGDYTKLGNMIHSRMSPIEKSNDDKLVNQLGKVS